MSLQVTGDIKQKKWLLVFLLVMIQLRFAINLAGLNTDAFSAFVPDDSMLQTQEILIRITIRIEVFHQIYPINLMSK